MGYVWKELLLAPVFIEALEVFVVCSSLFLGGDVGDLSMVYLCCSV